MVNDWYDNNSVQKCVIVIEHFWHIRYRVYNNIIYHIWQYYNVIVWLYLYTMV